MGAATTNDLTVDLLGPLQVVKSGETVVFSAPMQRALLAFLALDPGRAAPVDAIVDALWERPPGQAANMVQQLVSALRRRLSSQAVTTRGRAYQLQLEPGAVDYARFIDLTRTAAEQSRAGRHDRAIRALETALGLWRGTPLLDLPDAPFVDRARVAMQQERDQAQLAYRAALLAAGRPAEAVPALERILHDHPLDERAAELLVRALGQSGRQADALDVYEATRRRLVDELGLDPGPGLAAAQQSVLRHELVVEAEARALLPRRRLPRPRTSLIGRDGVIDKLRGLFAEGAPLVTVTGAGGVGKTRVALAYAARALDQGPVFFVDLAPLSDPQQVLVEVAAAIGLRDYERDSLPDQVARMVAGTSTLLVLDNFEHLPQAADELARLLEALEPDTRVLVTSRGPLRITGEHVVVLDPLSATAPTSDDGRGSITTAPAVALYRERTEAAQPGFLDHTSDAAIAELCQRLDGLPLAIELAAARADLAPPELLVSNLDKRLALLGTGPRDAPRRHRTLQACIDWSVDHLSEPARALFGVLAVCSGGASLPAVHDVCSAVVTELDVTAALDELATHHLIRVDATEAGPRITMLDTIHERARDQLETAGLRRPAEAAHARHYLAMFTSRPTTPLWPPTTSAEVRLWSSELPNARAALRTLDEYGQLRDIGRLALALFPLWLLRGERDEAASWLRRVASAEEIPSAERTQAILRLAAIAGISDGVARASAWLGQATACGGHLADASVQVHLAHAETFVAYLASDMAGVARAQHRGIEAATRSNNPELIALMGTLPAPTAETDTLLEVAGDLLGYAKATHNEILEMVAQTNYSEIAARSSDPRLWRMGQRWGTRAAALAAALGDSTDVATASANAAACSLLLGSDPLKVAQQLAVNLDVAVRVGDAYGVIDILVRIAAALSAAGSHREAAGIAATAERLSAARGGSLMSDNAVLVARYLNPLPDLLGQEAYREAVTDRDRLTWDEAANEVLQLLRPSESVERPNALNTRKGES
jgi:predicted ATPase/DNA-binding SARP family transcriptional activator